VRATALALLCAVALAACGEGPGADDAAGRGRTVYLAQCTVCHASDPAKAGPVGPPVKGSSPELLAARILEGTYPPGYAPKRGSALMSPMPQLASSIADLAAFLK
jgi:mono/diheme cytochrome c family protein